MNQNDRQAVRKVIEALKDESLINAIDPSIMPVVHEDRKKYRIHPHDGLCTVAALLFLRYSNHPQDFDTYYSYGRALPYEGKDDLSHYCDIRHYFLRNRRSGETIDPTFDQFEGKITRLKLYDGALKCHLAFFDGVLKAVIGQLTDETLEMMERDGIKLAA